MKQSKVIAMGLFLSLGLSLATSLNVAGSYAVQAKHHEGHDDKDGDAKKEKSPCAEVECEKGDKLCYDKKRECYGKEFQNKLDKAKAEGVTAEQKAKWVEKLEKKISHKKERIKHMQDKVKDMESNLKQVKALKVKAA